MFLICFIGDVFATREAGSRCIPHRADAIRYGEFLQDRSYQHRVVYMVIRERAADVLEGRVELAAVILIFCELNVGKEDKGQLGVIDGDAV